MGIRNSAMTPNIEPWLEETCFTLPHRTPKPQKNYRTGQQKIGTGASPAQSDYG